MKTLLFLLFSLFLTVEAPADSIEIRLGGIVIRIGGGPSCGGGPRRRAPVRQHYANSGFCQIGHSYFEPRCRACQHQRHTIASRGYSNGGGGNYGYGGQGLTSGSIGNARYVPGGTYYPTIRGRAGDHQRMRVR